MSLRIRLYGDGVLRAKAEPVINFDADLKTFARLLTETMYKEDCIGLAAPQVGKSIQMFAIDVRGSRRYTLDFNYKLDGKIPPPELVFPLIIINPIFTDPNTTYDTMQEYCRSIPGIGVPVQRPLKITVQFQDVEGVSHTLEATDLFARCLLHENDHLEGKLIIDYANPNLRDRLKSKLVQIRRQQKSEEKDANKKKPKPGKA